MRAYLIHILPWNVFSRSSFWEKGCKGIICSVLLKKWIFKKYFRVLWNLVLGRYRSIRVDSVFQAVQLPGQRKQNDKRTCNRVAHIATGWHTHQQALPIWTPAWPMWMEITSLMVTKSLFYFLTSTKVKLSWSSGRALDRQQWVGRAASCGNVLAQSGDERASATVAKESRRGPARLESPGEPGFQQTNHRPECPHVWCIIA